MRGSNACLCSTTLNGQGKANTETCLHNAKEVAAFATGTLVLLGACVRKRRGGTEVPTNPNDNDIFVALQMVDTFKCRTSHPIFPATEPLSLGQLRKGGINYHFHGTFENKRILLKTLLARNLLCIYNRICQCYETEKSGT